MNTFKLASSVAIAEQNSHNHLHDNDVLKLWLYRITVPLAGYKLLLREHDFRDDFIAECLGFGEYLKAADALKYDQAEVRNALFSRWKELEKKSDYEFKDEDLAKNLQQLADLVGLNEIELAILKFTLSVHTSMILEQSIANLGCHNTKGIIRIFSVCLGLPEAAVQQALNPSGLLSTSGILWLDTNGSYDFMQKVELLRGLIDAMHMHHENPAEIFSNIIEVSAKAKLSKCDYPHLTNEISLLGGYLQQVKVGKRKGVNFLIYGVPGTGKTEFARMISDLLSLNLYEISAGNRKDKPMNAEERFRAYRLGQILCQRQPDSCILFDEIEDIFNHDTDSNDKVLNNKAWINHVLENNPVPAFWISNKINSIDDAYIRRFDYVLEINAPPRSVKEKLLNQYLQDLPVSDDWKKQMAEHKALVPAIIERSANVVRMSALGLDRNHTESALTSLLGNTMHAMGHKRPNKVMAKQLPDFKIEALNTNLCLETLCDGLRQFQEARICLYGPPGTGKTAFGKYVAEMLDLPLLSKKASDIMSPYVGQTEQNMAAMFDEARHEGAILMLDEADTFIAERSQAQHSWEVSLVNEMLTQIESFEGVFIATTNLMDHVDSAAMRRFDIKLKFDYMKPSQAKLMFEHLAKQYQLAVDHTLFRKMEMLELLTPGDFAAVRRKLRLVKIADASILLNMLEDECSFKNTASHRSIGFGPH